MSNTAVEPVALARDCPAILIPSGEEIALDAGTEVRILQSLGGSFTVRTDEGALALIGPRDADALGQEVPSRQPGVTAPEDGADPGTFDLERVVDELRGVYDPEIPVNVVDLGLIYSCDATPLPGGGQRVEIKMSMTAPGCGMGEVLRADARSRIRDLPGVAEVDIELVWDPPWSFARMSEAARLQLGMY